MAWEKTFLEGDERYRPFLLQQGPLASTWESSLDTAEGGSILGAAGQRP